MTPRQKRFVEEYLIDLNGTQAAIRAGYAPGSADVEATRLLANARIADAVARAKAERSRRTGFSADRVLEELAAVGLAKLGDFMEWDDGRATLLPSKDVDTRAVLQVKQVRKTVGTADDDAPVISCEQTIKLHDKVAALKLLGQHVGLFTEKHEVSGPDGGPLELKVVEEYVKDVLSRR